MEAACACVAAATQQDGEERQFVNQPRHVARSCQTLVCVSSQVVQRCSSDRLLCPAVQELVLQVLNSAVCQVCDIGTQQHPDNRWLLLCRCWEALHAMHDLSTNNLHRYCVDRCCAMLCDHPQQQPNTNIHATPRPHPQVQRMWRA